MLLNMPNLDPGTTELWENELIGTDDFVGVAAARPTGDHSYSERWLVFKDSAQPTRGNLELNDFPAGLSPFFAAAQSNRPMLFRNSAGSFGWILHDTDQDWTGFKNAALTLMNNRFMAAGQSLANHVRGFDGSYTVIVPLTQGWITALPAEPQPAPQHLARVRLGNQDRAFVYAEGPIGNSRMIYQIAKPEGVVDINGADTRYENVGTMTRQAFLADAMDKQNNRGWIFTRGTVTRHEFPFP